MADKKNGGIRGLNRRRFLKGAGGTLVAASTLPLFNINHVWSQDVTYDGGIFDAGGVTLNVGEWGGFWEEFMRANIFDQFEKDFNCKIAYDASWPWFPKFVSSRRAVCETIRNRKTASAFAGLQDAGSTPHQEIRAAWRRIACR